MKRCGTVLTFKNGVSRTQAAMAIFLIAEYLDLPEQTTDYEPYVQSGQRMCKMVKRPFSVLDIVKEFDDQYGGPVWYIP